MRDAPCTVRPVFSSPQHPSRPPDLRPGAVNVNEPLDSSNGYIHKELKNYYAKFCSFVKFHYICSVKHIKSMDPVLEALENYRLSASPEQKADDLRRLESECQSAVDAYGYVHMATLQQRQPSKPQNYNVNLTGLQSPLKQNPAVR